MNRRTFFRDVGKAALGLAVSSWVSHPCGASMGVQRERPPNFVFILIDDMGWVDTGCYGSTFYETPNIDRLAGQGVRFINAYAACPVCSPTRASILTGKYPARLRLTDWIPGHKMPKAKLKGPEFHQELPLDEVTIAEALKDAGYRSASIGKWHLGKAPFDPEHQGFNVNFAGGYNGHPESYFYPYKVPPVPNGRAGEYLTDRLTDEALRFIEENRDRPFFLYLPHYAVHTPLQAKEAMIAKYRDKAKPGQGQNNPTYAAMIQSVDEGVGRVMDKLEALAIAERTIVFFMSDNGGLVPVTSNAPLRAGKGTLYEGGIREPMIVRWPGVTEPGAVCDTPVISVDFFPTILDMAGVKPRVKDVDGLSLVPLLKHRKPVHRHRLYWHYPHYHPGGAHPSGAVRDGDYKLIESYENGHVELYNLKTDISEADNLAEKMPEKARDLRESLHRWLETVDAQMPMPNPDYDPTAPEP